MFANSEMDAFNGKSEQDLSIWLEERGVCVEDYGVGGSKSVKSLLHEITEGESSLVTTTKGKPLRHVAIISVNIKNSKGQSLYEAKQKLPNGGVRERNILLSEKVFPGEGWVEATERGIREELGSILPPNPSINILKDTYHMSKEQSTSQSYPGLSTLYVCHKVQASVAGLPDSNFVTEEQRPDGVLRSYWEWRSCCNG